MTTVLIVDPNKETRLALGAHAQTSRLASPHGNCGKRGQSLGSAAKARQTHFEQIFKRR